MAVVVRACTEDDITQVAALFVKAFRKGDRHQLAAVAAYFRSIYFANPWVADDLPSLVIDRDGAISGFIGVMGMPLRIDGRSVRAAVGGNLMVDPERPDPLATLRLLKQYFAGPQDLALTDTANTAALRLWSGCGGIVGRFSSMRWMLPLRPAGLGVSLLGRRTRPAVAAVLRPLARPVDAIASRRLHQGVAAGSAMQEASSARVLEFMQRVGDSGFVHLDGGLPDLDWLIGMCRQKQQFGSLRIVALPGERGDRGVALYYPNPRGIGQVVLMLAKPDGYEELLASLCADAREQGSTALFGQADPRLFVELGERLAVYVQRNEFVMLQSRDASLTARFAAGELSTSRLYGEWWTRMQGDVFA